jgi:hypothetical protein
MPIYGVTIFAESDDSQARSRGKAHGVTTILAVAEITEGRRAIPGVGKWRLVSLVVVVACAAADADGTLFELLRLRNVNNRPMRFGTSWSPIAG